MKHPRRATRSVSRNLGLSAALLALVLTLSSCLIFKLKQDLDVLYTEAVFVPGQINVDAALAGQPIVLLVEASNASTASASSVAESSPTRSR